MSTINKECLDQLKHASEVFTQTNGGDVSSFIMWLYDQYGYVNEDRAQPLHQQVSLFSDRPY